MAYAVTHVLITIIILDLFRDYFLKKKFSTHLVLIGGVAGLLPDIDIIFTYIYNFIFKTQHNFHREFTHSFLFVFVFIFIGLVFFLLEKEKYAIFKKNISKRTIYLTFFILAYGWFMHIALDCFFAGDGLLTFIPRMPLSFCMHWFGTDFLIKLDAVILVLWLIHEEWKHKIKDYI
ncbi:MAG: metal-dependent hydrolase [Candidatus Woesearchaeota archaeon]